MTPNYPRTVTLNQGSCEHGSCGRWSCLYAGLRDGRGFRKSLRVKKMAGYDDVPELTWAPDGKATFEYGASVKEGHPHVRWRRIGTHDIFKRP